MKELWLAFEGGGTKTRLLLADTDCNVLTTEVGGASSPLYINEREYVRETGVLLERVKRAADGAGGRVTTAGLAAPMAPHLVKESIERVFGKIAFIHAGEQAVALGLHGLSWGVALIAGTGALCAALNEKGEGKLCGGFGPQFGDEGSGCWIGREAIASAMRAQEGRGPATTLGERLCALYEIDHIMHILKRVDRSGFVPGTTVAACVPEVFDAARQGDGVAKGICRAAGTALGRLLKGAAAQVEFDAEPVPLVMTGGVFNGEGLITTPLRRVMRTIPITFDMYPPAPEPAMGLLRHMRTCVERRKTRVS